MAISRSRGYLPSVNRPFEEEDPLISNSGINPSSPLTSLGYVYPEQAGFSYDQFGTPHYTGPSGTITSPLQNYAQNRYESPIFEHYGMLGNLYGPAALTSTYVTEGGGTSFGGGKSGLSDLSVRVDHDLARKQAIDGTLQSLRNTYRDFEIARNPQIAGYEAWDVLSKSNLSTADKNTAFNRVMYPFAGAKNLSDLYANRPTVSSDGPFNDSLLRSGGYVENPKRIALGERDTYGAKPKAPSNVGITSGVYSASGGVRSYNTNFSSRERLFAGGIIQGPTHSLRTIGRY